MTIMISVLMMIIHVAQITGVPLNPPPCNNTEPCNCRYLKAYDQLLQIPCFNSSNNCDWYHEINGTLEQLPSDMANSSRLSLTGNFDPNSYGIFTANASNDSCCYAVIPPIGHCDNCSEIVVDGISRDNNEIVCKRAGDNLMIEAKIPKVFGSPIAFTVRCNGSDQLCPSNRECDLSTLKCNYNNLTTENDGNYTVYIALDTMITVNGYPHILEWYSNNVSVRIASIFATVAFDNATYNAIENTVAQTALVLSKPLLSEVTIVVLTSDVTAVGGVNYVSGPYMITFPANQTRASLNVAVRMVECNKTFNLTINSSSLNEPCSIYIDDPSLATVTIVDHNGNAGSGNKSDSIGVSVAVTVGFVGLVIILIAIC